MWIGLLGPTQVTDDAGRPVPTGGAKQRAVLAQLAREPNAAVPVDRLAEGLWGEQVPARFRQNVQVYVSMWRRGLDRERPAGMTSRIIGHRDAYELVAAEAEIDVTEFSTGADRGALLLADGRPREAAVTFAEALQRFRGQPLADLADQPFAGEWLSELEERRLEALEGRIEADLARGAQAGLAPELESLVLRYPVRERLWCQLVLTYYRNGRQSDALDTVSRARSILLAELGLDPGPALQTLHRQVLRQDPALLPLAPVTAAAALPVPLSGLIGQERAVDDVGDRIRSGTRLTVLIGPGGVGKTRLALAAAHQTAATGRTVVWLPLADETDAERVPEHLAAAVGHQGPLTRLADTLVERNALLVLDNVEQLPGIGAVLRALLEKSTALQALVTSRGPVGVPGEEIVSVSPMTDETDQLTLFAERARAVDPSFTAEHYRADILRICRAVDGLPLGIELVAARSRTHRPDELAQALADGGFDLAGVPDDTGRHGSVANSVRWSVELLHRTDRSLFAALSLFDTVDRTVVAAVCEDRDSLDRLTQVALIRPVETPAGRRFAMLATVRAVAAAELSEQTRETVLERAGALWVSRSAAVDPGVRPDARQSAQVQADLTTTTLIVRSLLNRGRVDEACTVVEALHQPLLRLNCYQEMWALAGAVLAVPDVDDHHRIRLAAIAAEAADRLADPRAADLLPEVDHLPPGDHLWRAKVHYIRTNFHVSHHAPEAARIDAAAGLAEAELTGSITVLANAYSVASWAALYRGDYREARDLALAQGDYVIDDVGHCIQLNDLAMAALLADDIDEADRAVTEWVRIAERISPRRYLEYGWKVMASVRFRQDRAADAASLLAAALASYDSQVDIGWALEACAEIGLAAVMAGHRVDGIRILRRTNGFATALGADNALPDRDEPVAAAHGIAAGSYGGPLPAGIPFADFVKAVREAAPAR